MSSYFNTIQAPLPLRPIVGPLGLSGPVMSAEVSVPLEAVIIYSNNVVKVVQTGRVLYTFEGMTVLYFYVTFDGVTIFRTSAPGDIFGGGKSSLSVYALINMLCDLQCNNQALPSF